MDSITVNSTTISLLQGDITEQSTDAIVNAANAALMGGGGVDGAIHRAGGKRILIESMKIIATHGPLLPGQAVMTSGGDLKAKYVIHTVGPVWQGGLKGEPVALSSAYTESLKLAASKGFESVAFPSISTGAYGYPIDKAAMVAIGSVFRFARENQTSLRQINFILHDPDTFDEYTKAMNNLARYLPQQ